MLGTLVFMLAIVLAITLGIFISPWFFFFYLFCFVPLIATWLM